MCWPKSTSVEQALSELLRVVTTVLEGQVGLFWPVQEDQSAVRWHDYFPADATVDEFVEASRREGFTSGLGLPGRCWARGEPLWLDDALKESGFPRGPAAAINGLHAGCAFPIWLRASVYGVMECFSRDVQAADPDLLRTLGIIGSQIGLFIERTEVEAALRENESRTRLIMDDHLLMLINDVLDFSKIEAGKLSLERIPFEPRLAIEESLKILAERASSKGLNLASIFHADVPRTLMGDPGRLRQIVMNLMGNAIKFTEEGEVVIQVALEAQTEQDAIIRITVSDSGIGIAEDVQQRLFQSFSQADASTTRKYGGTGLGLAICK